MKVRPHHLKITFAALAALATTSGPLAHHAFAPEFDASRPVEVRGVVTKLKWVNPHSWIYVDVKAADGTVTNWGFEFGAPSNLQGRGLTKAAFAVGTEVVIKGYLARHVEAQGYTVTATTLADGHEYQIGAEQAATATAAVLRH